MRGVGHSCPCQHMDLGFRVSQCRPMVFIDVFIDVLSLSCREAGFSGVRIFDGAYFGEAYGRETNVGFNMITAVC